MPHLTAPADLPSSRRFAAAFAALVVVTLVGAAALTPSLVVVIRAVRGDVPWPFSRIFDRVAVVLLVALLVGLRRQLGLARVAAAWRAESWRRRFGFALVGLAASLVPAGAVLAPAIVGSGLQWAGRTLSEAAWAALAAIPAALVVAVFEEGFFRVVVFRGLAATWDWRWAAAASAAFYSVVHFLAPDRAFAVSGASPIEGLGYLGSVLGRVVRWESAPAVFGLFLIGVVLAVALHRTGSLALCAALHAGWFVAVKVAILLTSLPPALAGGGSAAKRELLIGSPWVWCAVLATGLAVVALSRDRRVER